MSPAREFDLRGSVIPTQLERPRCSGTELRMWFPREEAERDNGPAHPPHRQHEEIATVESRCLIGLE